MIESSEKDMYLPTCIEGYILIPSCMAFGGGPACPLAFYVLTTSRALFWTELVWPNSA